MAKSEYSKSTEKHNKVTDSFEMFYKSNGKYFLQSAKDKKPVLKITEQNNEPSLETIWLYLQ